MSDILKKYLTADRGTRIQALRLTQAWRTGLAHQDLPPVLVDLLGELAAASALLAGNIKFDGSVVLQLQGNGPVRLIMVECTSTLDLRATAHLREGAAPPADATLQDLLNADGQGRFMVMLDPSGRQAGATAYQGIVPLEGDTVAEALQHYMKASEQLDTRLWLAADGDHAAGMLIQRLPYHGGSEAPVLTQQDAAETWDRTCALAGTLQRDELLATEIDTLIHRLFWEETLMAFDPLDVRWHCPCTRERVANMLRSLGQEEVEDILAERGEVDVSCDFCGKPYKFDAVDCAALFSANQPSAGDAPPTVH